jgi:hypothetical protein
MTVIICSSSLSDLVAGQRATLVLTLDIRMSWLPSGQSIDKNDCLDRSCHDSSKAVIGEEQPNLLSSMVRPRSD